MLFPSNKNIPAIYIKDAVIFPDLVAEITIGSERCKNAVDKVGKGGLIAVFSLRESGNENPTEKDFYEVGVIGKIQQVIQLDSLYKVYFNAENRLKIIKFIKSEPYFEVSAKEVRDDKAMDEETQALFNVFSESVKMLINSQKALPLEAVIKIFSITDANELVNNVVSFLPSNISAKQSVLEEVALKHRLELANILVQKALEISNLEEEVSQKTQEELQKSQKELFLREEMKTIQKELGETENEFDQLERKAKEVKLPLKINEIFLKELMRLKKTPSFSPEAPYIRNYLDLIVELPWNGSKSREIDLVKAREVLERRHYGLEQVKERIIEYLAVSKLAKKMKSPILCFVGPPGTGKTSIGQSIAEALGRKFTRMSLGGIKDEAEIKGHRRTYVGAMPGRIIQGIKNTGSIDPVFMLDEIDKVGSDYRGDPSAALLEALDPEQNNQFSDHYLELPYDLSKVIFITTANILDTIPKALIDRMEVIEFSGYTTREKFEIAKKYIIPQVIENHGLSSESFSLTDDAIYQIIERYTHEAGVRNLQRELSKLARKIALKILENGKLPKVIDREAEEELIGAPKAEVWIREVESQIGLVPALAVTESGGEVLSVEAALMPGGSGNLVLTGQLGEVMKESAQTALSFIRSVSGEYGIDPNNFNKNDVHVHVPAGASRKDGPSAGAAIALAILSAIIKKPVDKDIGMTGEITLRGRILRIGGLREKILAAKRAGLNKVIFPSSNRSDFNEIKASDKENIEFSPVSDMKEILKMAFK